MQFDFDINDVLKKSIELIDHNSKLDYYNYHTDVKYVKNLQNSQKLSYIIDVMGNASKLAQNLPQVITTSSKLRNSDHKVYVSKDESSNNGNGEVVGLLKVGFKKLFVYDLFGNQHETKPLCVLDFYVHESKQRRGFGKSLFEFMLQKEGVAPYHLAIDRPSPKFLSFLNKHYRLTDSIPQSNNFVVFPQFFSNDQSGKSIISTGNVNKISRCLPAAPYASIAHQTLDACPPNRPISISSINNNNNIRRVVTLDPIDQKQTVNSELSRVAAIGISGPGSKIDLITNDTDIEPPVLPRGDSAHQRKWYLNQSQSKGAGQVPGKLYRINSVGDRIDSRVLPNISHKYPNQYQSDNRINHSATTGTRQQFRSHLHTDSSPGNHHSNKRSDYNYLVGLARNYAHTRIW